MPISMPMWPAVFTIAVNEPAAGPSSLSISLRRRRMIADDTVRREVTEAQYRAALGSPGSVEVARRR